MYKCDFCDYTNDNSDTLKAHIGLFHQEVFKCDKCPKVFKKPTDLRKHTQAHINESYCHTYNNFPRCKYGNSCIFLHTKAPFCKYDGFCYRSACQYQHKYGCVEVNRFKGNDFMKRRKIGLDKPNNNS